MKTLEKWLGLLLTDKWSTNIVFISLLIGGGFCQFSFDWQAHRLAHPLMNLAGLLLLLIVPWVIGIVHITCQNWQPHLLRPEIMPEVSVQSGMCIGYPLAVYYSSGQGYLSADAVVLLLILSICSLGLLLVLTNHRPVH